jgi:hypothetical protein
MYITGEETGSGKFYATDQVTRTMWEVPALGLGNWENAAQVDTGNTTHVAIVLNSDAGGSGAYLQLYVGRKGLDSNGDGTIDFLERNGLRGGTFYYFTPDPPASTSDLPDGTVTGKWNLSTAAALRETSLEDIHTNPLNGTQLVFADQSDGVYRLNTPLQFSAGTFNPDGFTVTISQIDNEVAAPLGNPDNLVWSRNGKVYVEEDGDGYEIWEINQNGGEHVRVAQGFSEPSGIIDISAELGYQPGKVLLSSIMGSIAQLVVLIAPTFPLGDYNRNNVVDAADYVVWRKGLGTTYNQNDFTVWRAHFGQTAGSGLAASANGTIPEPATLMILIVAAAGVSTGWRWRKW